MIIDDELYEDDYDDDDDFEISLPLWELNRLILEDKNYDTFEISPNTGEK